MAAGVAAARMLFGDGSDGKDGARTRCVLFDFDGPVCRLFPEGSSIVLADRLRALVADFGLTHLLTGEELNHKDPHLVLRAIHGARWKADPGALGVTDEDLAAVVDTLERCVTVGEMEAAWSAWPTPDADSFVRRLVGAGLRLAIVTNNSPLAADLYLRSRGLREHFTVIHGRTADPDLMKPHPDVLLRALRSLDLPPEAAVMIGDTPADVEAAARADVRFIGYGRNEAKRARLRQAGTEVVLEAYAPLSGELWERGAHEPGVGAVGEAARR
ncbi:HAD family hydrolase [Streptomyces sp. NPDC049541]|uniref:HAD family hydrolase n=1 Tax=Streptomyces sp. NPDC049541 TaxID=3365594 RepID=UPI003790F628